MTPVASGAPALSLAFSTEAARIRSRSRSTAATCATRSPTAAPSSTQLDSSAGTPAVLKELVRHPVSGEYTHIDLLRVRLDQAIQAPVSLDLTGGNDAPGVKEGGVLEQLLREVTVEALPTSIPDSIQHDISTMAIGDTLTVASVTAPSGVTILTDGETLVATLTPPRLRTADEEEGEIETETEVVGEGDAAAAGEADEASGGDGE